MEQSGSKPLLTFAVISFNQEQFVQEAVEAAFAQTYSPLEIVLSDVCSDDKSFEIMRHLAEQYQGPHRVILNRMPVRKAIGGHLNRVMEISSGELVFCAAADDVSLPQRTQAVYEAWEYSGRKATSIHSDYLQINSRGEEIAQILGADSSVRARFEEQKVGLLSFVETLKPTVFGCTHAYARSLYQVFGNLPDELTHEDDVLALRSVLAGKLLYVNEKLVKYRVHEGNIFLANKGRSASLVRLEQGEERLKRYFRNRAIMYNAFVKDLETAQACGVLTSDAFAGASAASLRLMLRHRHIHQFLDGGLLTRLKLLLNLKGNRLNTKDLRMLLPRLLPRALLLRSRQAWNYFAMVRAHGSNP